MHHTITNFFVKFANSIKQLKEDTLKMYKKVFIELLMNNQFTNLLKLMDILISILFQLFLLQSFHLINSILGTLS